MNSKSLDRYRKRMIPGPWSLEGSTRDRLDGAVVIPACAERASLPQTLASLAANPQELLQNWLIVVVVNQPPEVGPADREENAETLEWLRAGGHDLPNLAWVDASSDDRQFPKDAGVGLARKIGLDLALSRLEQAGAILASLDADTLVEPGYLQALTAHFSHCTAGGATLPFAHQPADTPELQAAIDRYELYLRHYVYGLQQAGSPYAYHSIGSALSCRASAYLTAGGMNRRKAGEDFYFLQQLAKTSGVNQLAGTTVYPSPRQSHRVPFGTGEKVARMLSGEEAIAFYPKGCYVSLGTLLTLAKENYSATGEELLQLLTSTEPEVAAFLQQEGLPEIWDKLRAQHRTSTAMHQAFHGWFDALKSWRLIRHLGQHGPKEDEEQLLTNLLQWGGDSGASQGSQLEQLRRLQGVPGAGGDLGAGLCYTAARSGH